jgi:DNA polymerase III alpha subunit
VDWKGYLVCKKCHGNSAPVSSGSAARKKKKAWTLLCNKAKGYSTLLQFISHQHHDITRSILEKVQGEWKAETSACSMIKFDVVKQSICCCVPE